MSKKYDLECGEKWYEHQPLPVIENDQVNLVWDGTIVTDRRVSHNRSDITLVLKDKHQWLLVVSKIQLVVYYQKNVLRL